MAYELADKLVVGVASSALFDLAESDAVFRSRGEAGYRAYQESHLSDTLAEGVAFPFVQRLLSLNDMAQDDSPLVEVIILSRNDPETGLRVMRSIQAHDLAISRAIFMQGKAPYKFMGALNMSLFLSGSARDVREAIRAGFAAGQVIGSPAKGSKGNDLRIAFDFDGILSDDSSQRIMQKAGLRAFQENEAANAATALPEGLLTKFLRGINRIQDIEEQLRKTDEQYCRRVHVGIVTARNAPAHERVVKTLQQSGLRVNDAFFLGGIDKTAVVKTLKPHIFFDDQKTNLEGSAGTIPCVHVPFGVLNGDELAQADTSQADSSATATSRH